MKYIPTFIPDDPEDLPRHLDEEFSRISDATTPDRWDHTHVHVTAEYNAGETPFIFADATAGAFDINLPAPFEEMILCVKKVDSSANAVTLQGGGNNIDGSSTYALSSQYDSVTVYWDKEEPRWWIV